MRLRLRFNQFLAWAIAVPTILLMACGKQSEENSSDLSRSATDQRRLSEAFTEVGKSYHLIPLKSEVGKPTPIPEGEARREYALLGEYRYIQGVILQGDIVTRKFGIIIGMPLDSLIAGFGKPDGSYATQDDIKSYVYLSDGRRVTFEFIEGRYSRSIWEP